MSNDGNKKREAIMKFALSELKKTMDDLKQGKTPTLSDDLKKAFQLLNEGYNMMEQKKITEQEMDVVLKEASEKLPKKTND